MQGLDVCVCVCVRACVRACVLFRILEVVASRRLVMYYKYGIFNRDLKLCPL